MITISATGTKRYVVRLPHYVSFVYSNPRQQVTRVSLAGNEVQQYSAKSETAGTFSYQGTINKASADTLDEMQFDVGECELADGESVWKVTIDAQFTPSKFLGKTFVTMSFRVIRKIA